MNPRGLVHDVVFTKRFCECTCPLFSRKYLRPHRTNGSKVLRCFPHCCPQHTETPFCSSSLAVRVTGPPDILEQCMVLMHFEASYDPEIACGDFIDEATLNGTLRSEANPRGEWIPTRTVISQGNTRVFEYNADAECGWNYRWLGGSSTQQRRCWHCIKAYVVHRVLKNDRPHFKVIATVRSSPFIVMSYRRACKSCQKKTSADPVRSATYREACECEGVYRLSDSNLDEVIANGSMEMQILPAEEIKKPQHIPRQKQMEEAPVLNAEQQLGLLYFALNQTTNALASGSELLRRMYPMISQNQERPRIHLSASCTEIPECDYLERHCIELLMSLLRSREHLSIFLHQNAQAILNRQEIQNVYDEWNYCVLQVIHASLESFGISPISFFQSIQTSAQSLDPNFSSRSSLLTRKTFSQGFQSFIAQLREVYLGLEDIRTPILVGSQYDGTWCYDPEISHIDKCTVSATLLTVFRMLTMCLKVQITATSSSIRIRSTTALFPTIWSEYILDSKPRVFRVFSNGESTMSGCGELLYGDYVGWIQSDCIILELFTWPTEMSKLRRCYVFRLKIQISSMLANTLFCNCDIRQCDNIPGQNPSEMAAEDRMKLLNMCNCNMTFKAIAGYRRQL